MSLRVVIALALTTICEHAWGQFVISAKSGLVNHVEGLVLLSGEPVAPKSGFRAQMKDGSELRAEDGRAEVLLNPSVFLRIGKNSMVRMVSNNLADTWIEFVSGAAIIGPGRRVNARENSASSISIACQQTVVHLRKNGIYRFDSEPAQLRVYTGQASIARGEATRIVGAGEMIDLTNPASVQEFDVTAIDSLGLWSWRRAAYISMSQSSVKRSSPDVVRPRPLAPLLSH